MTTSAQVVETSVTTTDNSPFLGVHSPELHYYKPWSYEQMTVDIWKSYKLGIAQLIGSNPARPEIFPTLFRYYLRSVQCFEDCFHIYFLIRSSHIRFLYIHSHFCFLVKNLGCENLREISKLLWPKTKSKVTIPFTKYSETSPRSLLRCGKYANLGTLSRTWRILWFTAVRFMWSVWPPP